VSAEHLDWLAQAGLMPSVHRTLVDLDDCLWSGSFDPVLMELVRLRAAQLLGVEGELVRRTPAALAAGLDETLVSELPQWPSSPRFDTRTRAAIGWSEQWILDVRGITDADAARLQELFAPDELAALTMAVAVFEMIIRARGALAAA
jgi:alkylhydroperoxidase family enzyme